MPCLHGSATPRLDYSLMNPMAVSTADPDRIYRVVRYQNGQEIEPLAFLLDVWRSKS